MAAEPKLINRDVKLTQWLNEAHAKEAQLEADLTAHIALTQKAAYKKRLQQHLKETRQHKRDVAKRIKKLGAAATSGLEIAGAPSALGEVAGKAVSGIKAQLGTARAMVTEQSETHLRNAQEELREENVEIALYLRIEAFAAEVGDRETMQLAKQIRRDEERMAKYLTAELPRLVKDLVKAEIPRDQRTKPIRARRATSKRKTSKRGTSSTSTTSRSRRRAAA